MKKYIVLTIVLLMVLVISTVLTIRIKYKTFDDNAHIINNDINVYDEGIVEKEQEQETYTATEQVDSVEKEQNKVDKETTKVESNSNKDTNTSKNASTSTTTSKKETTTSSSQKAESATSQKKEETKTENNVVTEEQEKEEIVQEQTKQEEVKEEEKVEQSKQEIEKEPEEKYIVNNQMINKLKATITENISETMKEFGYEIVVDKSIITETNQFTFTEYRVKNKIKNKFGTIKIYAQDYYYNGEYLYTECYLL